MKYTIPYDDKITLPHIKKIESIGISTDNLNYDRKELCGEVIITGDYLLDNTNGVMEFKHNIPVSLLIDDAQIEPQINISNFKYELIPGRGIEVIFDLDVVLVEDEEDEKVEKREEIDLEKDTLDVDTENSEIDEIKEESKEIVRDEISEVEEEKKEIKNFQDQIDKNLDKVLNSQNREEEHNREEENDKLEEIIDEIEDDGFSTKLESTLSTFDTSFVPRDNDKFTTYKILLVENDESFDEILDNRNLSKALVCKEYQFGEKKIVLKLEDD